MSLLPFVPYVLLKLHNIIIRVSCVTITVTLHPLASGHPLLLLIHNGCYHNININRLIVQVYKQLNMRLQNIFNMSHSVMIRKTCLSYTYLKDVWMADAKIQLPEILMDYNNVMF